MQQRLEDKLLGSYSNLCMFLQGKGHEPVALRPNGFTLYEVTPPGRVADQYGTYFAMRQLPNNTVEKAIVWEAGSLEEAVSSLEKLPGQRDQHSHSDSQFYRPVRFAVIGSSLVSAIALLSGMEIPKPIFTGALLGVTSFYGIPAGLAALRALARKATYYLALKDFRNASADRGAVVVLKQFFEV